MDFLTRCDYRSVRLYDVMRHACSFSSDYIHVLTVGGSRLSGFAAWEQDGVGHIYIGFIDTSCLDDFVSHLKSLNIHKSLRSMSGFGEQVMMSSAKLWDKAFLTEDIFLRMSLINLSFVEVPSFARYSVRQCDRNDAEILANLICHYRQEIHGQENSRPDSNLAVQVKESVSKGLYYILRDGDIPAAYVRLGFRLKEALSVSEIWVNPACRGKGLAGILVGRCLQKVKQEGVENIIFQTGNVSAIKSYSNLGAIQDKLTWGTAKRADILHCIRV